MANTNMIPVDPINQTYAIIFSNVPSNYTCEDIILKHLTKSKRSKTEINHDRWKKIIRTIEIKRKESKCYVIFSSIFYWCKYIRIVDNREHANLEYAMHPNYLPTLQHPYSVNLLSTNANNQLINLYNMRMIKKEEEKKGKKGIISYTFMYDNNIYISTKP
eukprot:431764_1